MPFIEQLLGFIGIKDVEIVYAEGISMRQQERSATIVTANDALAAISA